jgi:hypothetical protein
MSKIQCEKCPIIDFCPNTNPEYSMKQVSVYEMKCPLYRLLIMAETGQLIYTLPKRG